MEVTVMVDDVDGWWPDVDPFEGLPPEWWQLLGGPAWPVLVDGRWVMRPM